MRILSCLLLVAAAVFAGCLQPQDAPDATACSGDGPALWGALDRRTPKPADGTESDPRQPWMTVAALRGDASFGLDVASGNATVTMLGNGTDKLAILEFPPAFSDSLVLTFTSLGVECRRFPGGYWDPGAPREGATVEAGAGALVRTAGFLENGTLFYTNMPEIHAGPPEGEPPQPWPRTSWYEWGGDDLLPVYIYHDDASEMPPHWGAANQVGPLPAPAGDFAPGLPGQYFATIKGFNEALKGLSTSTVTVVRIAPEDAYTRAGNEEHPLYGQALVFLIQAAAVADQPCPADWRSDAAYSTCFRR